MQNHRSGLLYWAGFIALSALPCICLDTGTFHKAYTIALLFISLQMTPTNVKKGPHLFSTHHKLLTNQPTSAHPDISWSKLCSNSSPHPMYSTHSFRSVHTCCYFSEFEKKSYSYTNLQEIIQDPNNCNSFLLHKG